jgi:hypothetical protein
MLKLSVYVNRFSGTGEGEIVGRLFNGALGADALVLVEVVVFSTLDANEMNPINSRTTTAIIKIFLFTQILFILFSKKIILYKV